MGVAMSDDLHVSLPPRLSELRTLANMVEAFGYTHQIPETKIFVVNLALDELITNAVTYGFENVADPKIDIRLSLDGDALILAIEDNGTPFDPTEDTNPDLTSSLDDRRVGNLGLHFVKTFAARVSYEYSDNMNRLILEHDLKREKRRDLPEM